VIVAHPDDAKFWAGGTIAGWTDAGMAVTYCALTDGETGGYNASVPRGDIPRIRRAEQRDAAALLGVEDSHLRLQGGHGRLYSSPPQPPSARSKNSCTAGAVSCGFIRK